MTEHSLHPNRSENDVMTVERLRAHLFGGPQVPFWNYDPKQLTFGVEVEYFIAHTHGLRRCGWATLEIVSRLDMV